MSFEDWWYEQEGFGLRAERFFEEECERDMQLFINMKKWLEAAYEAGTQEGIHRMYMMYDFCPECKVAYDKHKMDCSRGRNT
jgi:hypothetical protein